MNLNKSFRYAALVFAVSGLAACSEPDEAQTEQSAGNETATMTEAKPMDGAEFLALVTNITDRRVLRFSPTRPQSGARSAAAADYGSPISLRKRSAGWVD